jgi:thioredoxin-related protein
MNPLRSLIPLLLLAWAVSAPAQEKPAVELVTESTFDAASARAKKEGRLVFLQFVSGICPHCKKFREQVFESAVFREFAAKHLVILTYDIDAMESFPEAEQKVERILENKFNVGRTPTIVILSTEGTQLLRTEGYGGTPAEKVVGSLKGLLEKKGG